MDQQSIKEIVQQYSHEELRDVLQIIGQGYVNDIYIVTTERSKYVVRSDPNESTIDRFKKEAWCQVEASKQGIIVPEVLQLGLKNEHPYMLLSHVAGISGQDSDKDSQDRIWRKLGEYARKIHFVPASGYGESMSAPGIFSDSWTRYLDYNISSLTRDDKAIGLGVISEQQSERIKEVFLNLKNARFNLGLTHDDLSLKNTILTTDDEVCLIDWGSAMVAPVPHVDIAEILNSSLDQNSRQFALFLEGYGLTHQDFQEIRVEIDQLNLLIHMDKLRWAIDRKKERIEHFSQQVKTKLAKVC
ncbi:MAG: phosphotransferase [Candidatus Vogelbacteria bacterium CG10_big_fil_rev_8_21_14_0_10_51_16]|uniref:Phosphotransferase n=1 Tax=Candidatus Vogelbacteria bacterium CG10_big_fil_rev_8_21_14_0_10_51_16 TaxID=1975045 RepID=A0A2H0RDB7_9BACT|nr:MAG: phosphotransferase [Candidatus Vogelbacteria bacterium CG10_big_fil_rev_8_21_14_0_10_51_16]